MVSRARPQGSLMGWSSPLANSLLDWIGLGSRLLGIQAGCAVLHSSR